MKTLPVINLLPERHRLQRTVRNRIRGWSTGVIIYTSCMLAIWGGYACTGGKQYSTLAAKLDRAVGEEQSLSESMQQLVKQSAQVGDELQRTRSIKERPDFSVLMGILSQTAGASVMFRDVNVTPGQQDVPAIITSTTLEAQRLSTGLYAISIQGVAQSQQDISQFILRLEKLHLFAEIHLQRSAREAFGNGEGVSFDLQCTISEQPVKEVTP